MKFSFTIYFLLLTIIASAHPSVSIIMDSKGNVYYSDLKQVWKIDTQGKKSVVVAGVHTHELYIDKNDNLYGEHLWYNGEKENTWGYYVWQLSPTGKLEKIIPPTEGFPNNYSFVRDQQGNMYYANRDNACQKVTRKNLDGTFTSLGDACMENIRWMTVTDDGIVFLIDLYDLKRIDKQGHVTMIAQQLQEKSWSQFFVNDQHAIMGISTDKQNNIYAAIYSGKKVKRISPDGKVSELMETNIPWSPTGTLAAPNGDFWILECSITNDVRVERITKNGERIIY
jgi:sugar lactone lactonase YvrE